MKTRFVFVSGLIFAYGTLLASPAYAVIIYELIGQIDRDFTATGTITTNGNIGPLADTDIVSSSITVTDAFTGISSLLASAPFDFTGVTATASALTFQGNDNQNVIFTNNGGDVPGDSYAWALRVLTSTVKERGIKVNGILSPGVDLVPLLPHTFATAIPEPSSAVLLSVVGLAVAGFVGGRSWNQKRKPNAKRYS